MDFVDVRYINLISSRLEKFKQVKPNLYNFRCPICGDSQRNKSKARGYLYSVKNNTNYKCHNCGSSLSFNNFLKSIDTTIYKQYTLEKFKEGHTGKNFVVEEPKFEFKVPVFTKREQPEKLNIPKASTNAAAKMYLERRKLDPDKFYYVDKFKEWTNSLIYTFDKNSMKYEEARIIIPIYYQNKFVGFQGRALGSNFVKYITIMIDENAPKIYGLDNIKKNDTVYVTEGPFDSTFICNSIAMCGADGDIAKWGINNYVRIYDNEPRNTDIVKRIEKCIECGEKVVIWPNTIRDKDINDMVLTGHNVQKMVELNTYSGLEAKLKFTTWKKI
jgi:ssDNA-binding Zn-finger/Zn-ribbon topoisomerase 1